jgi:hypothetical protein
MNRTHRVRQSHVLQLFSGPYLFTLPWTSKWHSRLHG